MDRTAACGAADAGSIPAGSNKNTWPKYAILEAEYIVSDMQGGSR